MVVVRDEEHEACAQRLLASGYTLTRPRRELHPDILATLEDPEEVMANLNKALAPLDRAAKVFDYAEPEEEQIYLLPNSFACLPLELEAEFHTYGNIKHPLERALVESFVKCALLEDNPTVSDWGSSLIVSVWTMIRYLDIENDILDQCTDARAVEFFSEQFGRKRDEEFGPKDFRISKRIGSGREMPIDSRGRPLQ